MLEAREGEVGDQVSGVSDERLLTFDDVGWRHTFAVPQAECLPLLQTHAVQDSVDALSSKTEK